jgi:Ca-activated chloride channel family protein
VYFNIRRKRVIKQFGNPELLAELMPNVSKVRPIVKFYLQLFALLLIITVLAQPQFGSREETTARRGIEVMIALDVSNSMLAEDVRPNRLENSKQIISQLIDNLDNDRIGLIVFAGDAFVQLPITADHISAKMFLATVNTNTVARQGTAIGSAIELAIRSFGQASDVGRTIILITDAENHEDDAVGATRLAVENGITVNVIGVGTPQGAPIPIPGTMRFRRDRNDNVVVTRLNEELAREIARAGNGIYIRADNTNLALRAISAELENLSTAEFQTTLFTEHTEQFQSFAIFALLLLLLDFFILNRKNKKLMKLRFFDLKDRLKK